MIHTAEKAGIVSEKLETAINIGCTMVSRSKKVRKKLNSSKGNDVSLKKSLKELDRMSIELIDKLFEINARLELPDIKESGADTKNSKVRLFLNRILSKSLKRIEMMKLTYQDIYSL